MSSTRTLRRAAESAEGAAGPRNGRKGRLMMSILGAVLCLYVAACALLYVFQRRFLYFPPRGVTETSEQRIELRSGDLTLRGWVVNPGRKHAVIYFGGNAERPETNIGTFRETFEDHTIYLLNYRGYGDSDGSPTETGLYADAEVVFDHAAGSHQHVSLMGRSLGTGVATHVASCREVHSMILIEPYDSMVNVARSHYPFFPVGLLLRDRYDSAERAGRITAPTLMIIAGSDEVIPRHSTDRLIEAFDPAILKVEVIAGATHNNIQVFPGYHALMRDFLLQE